MVDLLLPDVPLLALLSLQTWVAGLQDASDCSFSSPFQVSGPPPLNFSLVNTAYNLFPRCWKEQPLPWHSGGAALQCPVSRHCRALAPTRRKPSSQAKLQADWYLKAPKGWEQFTRALCGAGRSWHCTARGEGGRPLGSCDTQERIGLDPNPLAAGTGISELGVRHASLTHSGT